MALIDGWLINLYVHVQLFRVYSFQHYIYILYRAERGELTGAIPFIKVNNLVLCSYYNIPILFRMQQKCIKTRHAIWSFSQITPLILDKLH